MHGGQPARQPRVLTHAAGLNGDRREVGMMGMAMSNALALVRWHGFRSLTEGDTQDKFIWLIIGAALAVVVMWAVSRRRRRFF